MAMKLTTTQAKVQAGQQLRVKGILQYSSLTKKSEIKSKIQQAPAYSVTISNPQLVGVSPANKELALFLEGQMYQSAKHGDVRLTLKSTGHIAPKVFDKVVRCAQGVVLENELASGQVVEIMARAYKPKSFDTIGVALNAVLIEDANNIQYYSGGGASLSAFGIEADPNAVYTAPTTPVEQFAGQQDPSMQQGGFQQPAYEQQMQQGAYQQPTYQQGQVMNQGTVQQPIYQQGQVMNQGAVQQPAYEQQMQQGGFQQPAYQQNDDPFSQQTPFDSDDDMPF